MQPITKFTLAILVGTLRVALCVGGVFVATGSYCVVHVPASYALCVGRVKREGSSLSKKKEKKRKEKSILCGKKFAK